MRSPADAPWRRGPSGLGAPLARRPNSCRARAPRTRRSRRRPTDDDRTTRRREAIHTAAASVLLPTICPTSVVIVNPIDIARYLFFSLPLSHTCGAQLWSSSPSDYGQFLMRPSPLPKVRSRQINDADIDSVVDLLTRGFRLRTRGYWQRALEKLSTHQTPAEMPKFGYLLESSGDVVGVILLIFSSIPGEDASKMRCNVSSWYVEPAFRGHASLLISQAIKFKNVTYVNISPALHTRPIVQAQGFSRYSSGQFVAAPTLSMNSPDGGAKVIDADTRPDGHFEPSELDLLLAHKEHGCISLWCATSGRAYPFVFMPRLAKGVIPFAQLIYCRHI